jgi:hypothetical protein
MVIAMITAATGVDEMRAEEGEHLGIERLVEGGAIEARRVGAELRDGLRLPR